MSEITDSDSRYYAVARILLEEDVSLLMALNPSTILLLLRRMCAYAEELIQDVERGGIRDDLAVGAAVRDYVASRYSGNRARARALRALLRASEPALVASDVWPTLRLVVSWRSPMQRSYLRLLEPYLGAVGQRDYLLMASEGVIAIPLEDDRSGGVLATPFHFYEFIPEAEANSPNPTVRGASELEVGGRYLVLLSTSAGLYRYNIGDVVRVTGKREQTPVVEFLYRIGSTCSITGEKLTEEQVTTTLNRVAARFGFPCEGFTLHPVLEGFPHYALLVEPPEELSCKVLHAFLRAFDAELAEQNIEYAAKRGSARLGPPELRVAVRGAYQAWRQRRIVAGTNDAQIKPIHLSRDADFSAKFELRARLSMTPESPHT